jgi:hypothetical protein
MRTSRSGGGGHDVDPGAFRHHVRRMISRRASVALGALVFTAALLAGCVSSDPDRAAVRQRDPAGDRDWINRRASQLKASGLNDSQAQGKAESEFRSQFGYSPESYTLYDSGAKARAEQQKVKDGLEKLQRDR